MMTGLIFTTKKMNVTKKRLEWMIEYRGGMGNRIDAFDILDFIDDTGYLYKEYIKRFKR